MNSRTQNILSIIALSIIVLFLVYSRPIQVTKQPLATVSYVCSGGKTITAAYYAGETKPAATADEPPVPSGSVHLSLSDTRTMTLPQTLSADGGRYANTDESFVFWTKGNGALVLENNKEKSYVGCILVAPTPEAAHLTQVYANGGYGFSLRFPEGYTFDESYGYHLNPKKSILGVKFTVPTTTSAGTNLSSETYLSVEGIPQTSTCSATLFLDQVSQTESVVDGEITYSVASSTGAGAGNRYEETVYAIPGTNPCIAVRYYIHYGVIENYPEGLVHEFDREALRAQFDAIRRTLVLVQ